MRVMWIGLVVLMSAGPAQAQDADERSRGFIGGMGGMTFGDAATSGVLGAQGGVRLGGGVFVIGEFVQFQNILPGGLQNQLDLIARILELDGAGAMTLDGRLSGTTTLGGVRYLWRKARWSPFAEGGAGASRLRLRVDATGGTSGLAEELENEFGEDNPDLAATKPLIMIGGGITLRTAARWSVDGGYRFYRVFAGDPAINVNTAYGALKFHF